VSLFCFIRKKLMAKVKPEELKEKVSYRIDSYSFACPGDDTMEMYEPFEQTEDGYLMGRAVATNIGVFPYMLEDGSVRRELRLPDEVFHKDSIKSLRMKPMTNDHPMEKNGVTPDNIKNYQVGSTGDDIRTNAYAISVPMVITDKKAIEDVKGGKIALSCGYTVEHDNTPGNWCGVQYDCKQKNIRYNHLAIVDRGRAGDMAKMMMKMDSADNTSNYSVGWLVTDSKDLITEPNKGDQMKTVKLDGVEFELDEKVADKVASVQVKNDSLETEKNDLLSKVSALQGKLDSSTEQITALKNDVEEAKKQQPEVIAKAVQERISLVDSAMKVGVEVKADQSELEIQKAVILKVFPNAASKLDNADASYLKARFDTALEVISERDTQTAKNNQTQSDLTADNAGKEPEVKYDSAREAYIAKLQTEWNTSKEN